MKLLKRIKEIIIADPAHYEENNYTSPTKIANRLAIIIALTVLICLFAIVIVI